MMMSSVGWPEELPENVVCFSVDVEWACEAVLADLQKLFDDHNVKATFFVTHSGVSTPGHERGLHPNFRRTGETYRSLPNAAQLSDDEVNEHVVATTRGFAPEAKGLRSHSLHYDSTLLPLYARYGLQYDCSYQIPLVSGLSPFWKPHGILEIPTYYADHFDIITGATSFALDSLALNEPGIKVFDFHPNIVFLNAYDDAAYFATKGFYHDPEALLRARHPKRGVRTLLLSLLEEVAARNIPTATLGEVNRAWQAGHRPW